MENNNIYKSRSLPQVSAPFSYVVHNLSDAGIGHEMIGANVDNINPSQGFIDSDVVDNLYNKLKSGNDLKSIFIDQDSNVIDGHHRLVAYILNGNTHIPAIKLLCNKEAAIKHLTDIHNKFSEENNSELLNSLTEDNESFYISDKKYETNKTTVKGFRKKPIVEKSISGNFFALKEINGYKPYVIEFSNLLNTDYIDKKIKNAKNPPLALAEIWFKNLNFEEGAKKIEMDLNSFINSIVAEKARIKKIDGIQYGDKLLQSIDDK
jgi:hypothetical protein